MSDMLTMVQADDAATETLAAPVGPYHHMPKRPVRTVTREEFDRHAANGDAAGPIPFGPVSAQVYAWRAAHWDWEGEYVGMWIDARPESHGYHLNRVRIFEPINVVDATDMPTR